MSRVTSACGHFSDIHAGALMSLTRGRADIATGARKTSGLTRLVVLARAHAFGFRKSRVGRFSQTIAGNKTRKISKLEVGSINGRAVFAGG
jgi:hypothetical protein